jgi:hypothetical protein
MGRLAIFVKHINVLCLDELADVHPAGCSRVALYSDLATKITSMKLYQSSG